MNIDRPADEFLNACATGQIESVRKLLPHLPDIEVRHARGWTGLIRACHGNHAEIAKLLVANGANVNATNNNGTTVFMYAKTPVLETKDTGLLEWLLQNGAEINARDFHRKTVLDYVLEKADTELADFLRANGALTGEANV